MNKLIKSVVLCMALLLPAMGFAKKDNTAAENFDSTAVKELVASMLSAKDSYDPLIQQHFAFDAATKTFAVINSVQNRIELVQLEGTDELSLKKIGNDILVDEFEGRHDFAMIYRPQGIAIYDGHVVFLASNRDSCYLSVLTMEGEQVVKKYYRGQATAFSYSKERTELYIAGEFDLGYNIIVVNTEGGIANANYDAAPVFQYKKPRKAEEIKEHDPYGVGLTVIAMGVVFLTLLMLSIIFITYGKTIVSIQKKRAAKNAPASKTEGVAAKPIHEASGEEFAAISAAIHLYNNDLHDLEDTILTIQQTSRRYSPWSAKSLNMNNNVTKRR